MPPSPSLRFSPRRELRAENQHKRGRSYESGVSIKGKDDDLALFNDMQMKERENFLLQSNDDLEEALTKLKCFPDYRVDADIPVRREKNDLLNADSGKNDYDWLVTPPETPLFPYLDDEDRPVDGNSTRGRHRSQPVSIPGSSMDERSQRTSRSSASPHHRSPSPRYSGSTSSRGRASSAPHSSPSPALQPATPVRRSSTPPHRPSTPRASTPTHRKMSSGSSIQSSSSGRRGTSPSKGSRGSSPSPKLQEWQANMLGFSSDAPPNLRTSLSDRPASYTRGSSPASRNGREMHSKYNRQSMSPTASRSASSSHSYDLDRFSPHSKGSVISSGDDDLDSVRSVSTGISPSPTAKRNGAFVKSKALSFTKKPSLTPSALSAPKRSFDSSLRQVDQRKAPQNMFRPLLSSVPSSTFHISKTNTIHRPVFSRNSSLTTSSNASSELGSSIIPYNETIEHAHTDIAVEWRKMPDPLQEEESVSNSMDEIKEDISCEIPLDGHKSCEWGSLNDTLNEFENTTSGLGNIDVPSITSDSLYLRYDHANVDSCLRMTICSICNKVFSTKEAVDGKDICNDCIERDKLHFIELGKTSCTQEYHITPEEDKLFGSEHPLSLQRNNVFGVAAGLKHGYLEDGAVSHATTRGFPDDFHNKMDVLGCFAESSCTDLKILHNTCMERDSSGSGESISTSDIITEDRKTPDQQLDVQQIVNYTSLAESSSLDLDAREKDGDALFENRIVPSTSQSTCTPFQSESSSACSSTNVDRPERTGISVLLLDKSSNTKGPLVHGRTLTPSVQRVDPSYLRDNMQTMRLNSSWNSSTGSTSLDLGSSRPKDQHAKQKLGIKKSDHAYVGNDLVVKSDSLLSLEKSSNMIEDLARSCRNEDEDDGSAAPLNSTEHESIDENVVSNREQCPGLEHSACQSSQFSIATADSFEKKNHSENLNGLSSGSPKELDPAINIVGQRCSICHENTEAEDCSNGANICILPDKPLILHENGIGNSESLVPTLSNNLPDESHSSASGHSLTEDSKCNSNRMAFQNSSQLVISTKAAQNENHNQSVDCPQAGWQSASSSMRSSESHFLPMLSQKNISPTVPETSKDKHADDIHEGLKATKHSEENVKELKLEKSTKEKAADSMPFDGLVMDNFACKSAVSGAQEEQARMEPVHTVPETNNPGPMDQTLTHRKHTQNAQSVNIMTSRTDMKFPPSEPYDHPKIHKMPAIEVESTKPQKLESKCNCSIM